VEQHLPAADREWQVTQLVEDDEIDADELIGEAPGFSGTRFGLELIDQVDCGEEPNARAVAHAIGADRYRYMALAGAGAADQHGIALGDAATRDLPLRLHTATRRQGKIRGAGEKTLGRILFVYKRGWEHVRLPREEILSS